MNRILIVDDEKSIQLLFADETNRGRLRGYNNR